MAKTRTQQPSGLAALALICLIAAAVAPASGADDRIEGVAQVVNGKTVSLAGRQVRLAWIDVPEPDQTCRWRDKSYPCGQISGDALRDLITGASLSCRILDGSGAVPVGLCTADGFDVGGNLVYTGWAVVLPNAPDRYRAVQDEARAAGRGLWRGEFVRPAAWRAGQRLP